MRMGVDIPEDARPLVLAIDDSPDVHRLLKARLRQEELELLAAESGEAGLKLAEERQPALILLDLNMPGMDGFEVLRTLKERTSTLNIPVIILSGAHSATDKVTAFDLGAVDYVTKPFDLTELRVRLRSALRLHTLLQILSKRAQIDGLTGLWNRAHFDARWVEEVARSQRHGAKLSIAMVDIDHFKSINDTYGHPAGDAVLQGMGKLLQREGRQSDVPCRYGGEEFAVIMPETGPEDARVFMERLRVSLEAMTWPRHPERTVTCSIGVAGVVGPTAISAAQWVEAADRNLYAAKKGGRNRSVITDLTSAGVQLTRAG